MNDESPYALARSLPFKNVSGETIPAFAVMAITGIAYEEGVAFLTCDKPGPTFRRDHAVNNAFDVAAVGRGSCFRTGDVRALYDSGSPAAGEGWGPKNGQWSLAKGYPGFTIDGIVNAGHRIARVGFSPIVQALVKATADIGRNTASTSYRVYTGTLGSETDAGFTSVPAAHNRSGHSLANGEWAWLSWANNGWELCSQQNRVYHVTATGAISGGGSASITLPDGRTVSATNWSSAAISTGDKVVVWQDFLDGVFYVGKFGGTSVAEIYHVTIPSPGVASLASINITLPTTVVVSAKNWSSDRMDTEDYVTVYKDGNDGNWYLIKSGGGAGSRWIKFRLATRLTTGDASSASAVVVAYWGGADPGGTVTIGNSETDYPGIYKYSGDASGVGYATYDASGTKWRIVAIEGDGRRWQFYLNISGETFPAYGVLEQSDAFSDYNSHSSHRPLLLLEKVSATYRRTYWINGEKDVLTGNIGLCCSTEGPVEVLYHSGEITLSAGDSFGPKPNSFELWQHRPGFTNLGGALDSGTIYVEREPVQQLLVQTSGDIGNDDDSSDYNIMVGAVGSEANSGFTTVPLARNRTDDTIASGTMCYLIRTNSGWHFKLFSGGGSGATEYFALLNGAMECTDSSGTIDTVTTLAGGTGPSVSTAINKFHQAGADNAPVLICKMGSDYFIKQVDHVESQDVINVKIEGAALKQTKQKHAVQTSGGSTDSTIDTLEYCEPT